jgi:hypothetical protein
MIVERTIAIPNPWKMSLQIIAIINQINHDEIFPSRIGAHDLWYASFRAKSNFLCTSSSFNLSKIRILESTHIQMLRIIAAIFERDNAYPNNLYTATNTIRYNNTPAAQRSAFVTSYIYHNRRKIRTNEIPIAYNEPFQAFAHKVGSTDC